MTLQAMTSADSALGGMRNDHSSTVKKAGFPNKSANSKSGHIRRLSTGPGGGPPPAKVVSKCIWLLVKRGWPCIFVYVFLYMCFE